MKTLKVLIHSAALIPCFLLLSVFCAQAETISLRADVWCPYNCEPDADRPGILIEIAKYAFESKGHKVDYKILPWSRAIVETREGAHDGIIGAFKEDAPDFVFPREAAAEVANVFFVKRGEAWQYTGRDSLTPATIGVIKDYSYGEMLDAYIKQHAADGQRLQIVPGENGLALNVKKLLKGRITAVLEERMVMRYYLLKNNQADMVSEAGLAGTSSIYIAFSPARPRSAEYAEILAGAVLEMKKNGLFNKILEKYGLNNQAVKAGK